MAKDATRPKALSRSVSFREVELPDRPVSISGSISSLLLCLAVPIVAPTRTPVQLHSRGPQHCRKAKAHPSI